jgi:hypothetical protein
MADYHPLIARAVAGLEKNTGENRRALYERARTALVAQLRGVAPPLDESEITRERLALEEAIRKVEAESARHAREVRPAMIRREHPRREPPPRMEAPRREEPARTEEPPRATGAAARPGSAMPQPSARVAITPAAPAAPKPVASQPAPSGEAPPAGSGEPAAQRPSGARRTLSDEALRGFRDVVTDPRSAAESRRPDSYDYGAPPPPSLPPAPSIPPPEQGPLEPYGGLEPQAPPENLWVPPLDGQSAHVPVDFDRAAGHVTRPPLTGGEESEAPSLRPPRRPRSYSGLIRLVLVLVLLGAVGGAAYWQRDAIGSLAGSIAALVKPSQPARETAAPPGRAKITDRIGQPAQQPSTGLPVAQRVVLYEEDPADTQGKRYVGTVLWRTEMKPAAPGRPPELAVRADIEVPERKMAVTWSLRRNTDPSLPASHTIEIMFNLPDEAAAGGVQNVPGVLMKQAEQTRGVPLAGLAVKVTPGYFLIGLSALETDKQRNIQLLKERAWFDIPVVYNNNRRAILAMEKGTPGERAFAEAFAAWKE